MNASDKIAVVTFSNAMQVGRRMNVEEMQSDILRQAHVIWSAKRGTRIFPARSNIAPRDLSKFLRNVTLYRVFNAGKDFEYRIMGDAAVVAFGRSFRGMGRADLNVLQPGMGDVIARVCRWVAREREPLVMRGILRKGVFDARRQESIFLPLGEDGETVDHILSVGIYVPQSLSDLKVDSNNPDRLHEPE